MRRIVISIISFLFINASCFSQWNNFLTLSTFISMGNYGTFTDANFISPGSGMYGYYRYWSPSSGFSIWLKSTSDTGNTWSLVYSDQDLGIATYSIDVVRSQSTYYHIWNWQGFIRIFKSSNNGGTWSNINASAGGYHQDFSAIDSSHFYLLYSDYSQSKYFLNKYDGAITLIDSFINEYPRTMFFADTAIGYIAASTPQSSKAHLILKTTSGGTNWSPVYSDTAVNITKMYFLSLDTGYAAGYLGKMLKTINGGTNWQYLNTGVTAKLNTLYFINDSIGFAAGDSGTIIRTTDGGNSWSQDSTWTHASFRRIFFFDDSLGYAITDGSVYRTNLYVDVGVWEPLRNEKDNLSIYPNPVMSNLTVNNRDAIIEQIEIYNLFGEKVYHTEVRRHKSEIDVSGLRSGIYFVMAKSKDGLMTAKFVKE